MGRKGLLPHAPIRAVEGGEAKWGRFRGEFGDLNLGDFRVGGLPKWASGALLKARRKAWQHVAVFGKEICLSVAAVDAGVLNSSFVCAVEVATDEVVDYSLVRLPGVVHIPLKQSGQAFGWNTRELVIEYRHTGPLEADMKVATPASQGRKPVVANLKLEPADPETSALVSLLPFPSGLPFYSLKGPCKVSGFIQVGEKRYELDPATDFALVDYHRACYPWKTFWQWVTLAWRTQDGKCAALNLTRNIIDDERHGNENVLWLGESLEELAPARFRVPEDPMAPWQIHTADGSVNLEFRPFACRKDSTGALLISSAYVQVFGRFFGSVVDGSGERVMVDGVVGVAESHNVRW